VTAATDTGHSAALEAGASFALNRQKLLDFGFRSLHVTAETAKMLARTYYGGTDEIVLRGLLCIRPGRT
jgi:feruloyl esterase